jgi:hypothetical protein
MKTRGYARPLVSPQFLKKDYTSEGHTSCNIIAFLSIVYFAWKIDMDEGVKWKGNAD